MRNTSETTRDAVAHEISEHPFLRGLSPSFLDRISQAATPRAYASGEYLLREGEEAKHLFLIDSGEVALELVPPGRPHLVIEIVGAGTMVGWSIARLWSGGPRHYELDARALVPTHAIAIDAERLRGACDDDPANGYKFLLQVLTVMADRLANTRVQLAGRLRG